VGSTSAPDSPSLLLSLGYSSIATLSRSSFSMDSAPSSPSDRVPDVAHARGETIDGKELESSHASVADGSFIEGSEGVTHEELATLRHLPNSIPFTAFLIVIVEFAERWTYYGEPCVTPWTIQIVTTYTGGKGWCTRLVHCKYIARTWTKYSPIY